MRQLGNGNGGGSDLPSPVPLRLRVWRPSRWNRGRVYFDVVSQKTVDPTSFHECVYSWAPHDNPLDSTRNAEEAAEVKKTLDMFQPHQPMMSRTIQLLRGEVKRLESTLALGRDQWGASAEEFRTPLDEVLWYRHNPLRSLLDHFRWVCDTFEHVPGCSVTLR